MLYSEARLFLCLLLLRLGFDPVCLCAALVSSTFSVLFLYVISVFIVIRIFAKVAFVLSHDLGLMWRREQASPAAVQHLFIVAMKSHGICVLHGADTDASALGKVKHGLRISALVVLLLEPVAGDPDAGGLLVGQRHLPGLVDVLWLYVAQLGDPAADEGAVAIPLLAKGDGAVDAVVLGEEGNAGEPLPVANVAGGLVVEEELLKDLCAALPVDVAAAAGEEAGDAVAAEVVDPAVVAELAHEGVDPGEAGCAGLPAAEPGLGLVAVDVVVARGEARVRVALGGEVPGDEAAVGVGGRLGKGRAEGGLGGEVHVAEEDLADEALRGRGGARAEGVDDLLDAVVEEADGEGAKVEEGGEQRRGRRVELRGAGLWLLEGRNVRLVLDELVEALKSERLAAADGRRGGREAELLERLDGEVAVGAGNVLVRRVFPRLVAFVDVGLRVRTMLLEIHGHVSRIGQTLGRRDRLRDRANLLPCGLQRGDGHGGLPVVVRDDFVAVPEGAAGAGDDLDACFFGCFDDGLVSGSGVCVRVLFKHQMSGLPGFEELGKECLRSFTQNEELGFLVQLRD